ncbi:Fungal Zn2-Cys6 binuclear cluster domain-containing protein, partial [Cladophialophora immunda]
PLAMFSTFSHRRSCGGCIKAKRRCDQRVPQCSRCMQKAATCVYENQPLTQPRTDLSPFAPRAGSLKNLAALPFLSIPLDLGYEPPVPDIRWRNSKITLCYLASKLQTFPTTFVKQGTTPFIHHRLYSKRSPHQIQQAYNVCEIICHDDGQDAENQQSILQPKLEQLRLQQTSIASFDDLLASVQALILYLVVCLFNNSPDLRRTGEQFCPCLHSLTRRLCEQAPAELSHGLSPWRAWYYAESVRRSILISHMMRAVYATMKQGYYLHTLYVEALPFDPQTLRWDARSESDWVACTPSTHPQILSYREYADGYATGTLAPTGLFERLLLIACYGKERVDSNLVPMEVHRA